MDLPASRQTSQRDGNPREHEGTRTNPENSQQQHGNSILHIRNSPRTRGELRLSHGNPNPRVSKSVCQSGSSLTSRCRSGLAYSRHQGRPSQVRRSLCCRLLYEFSEFFHELSRILHLFFPISGHLSLGSLECCKCCVCVGSAEGAIIRLPWARTGKSVLPVSAQTETGRNRNGTGRDWSVSFVGVS